MAFRTTEIFKDGSWISIAMEDLKKGDVFRMFEPDGTPVPDDKGLLSYVAASDAMPSPDGNTAIKVG